MQTFLPSPSFKLSATMLDRQRLGKQRLEAYQILNALLGATEAWRNHPATVMWTGCELALVKYGLAMCSEWTSRGYEDSMAGKFIDTIQDALYQDRLKQSKLMVPWWLGKPGFHKSHRSMLMRKMPDHYGKLWLHESDKLDYVWPPLREPVPYDSDPAYAYWLGDKTE
jgi:hypothetical protein